jgi:hypothetical protein
MKKLKTFEEHNIRHSEEDEDAISHYKEIDEEEEYEIEHDDFPASEQEAVAEFIKKI